MAGAAGRVEHGDPARVLFLSIAYVLGFEIPTLADGTVERQDCGERFALRSVAEMVIAALLEEEAAAQILERSFPFLGLLVVREPRVGQLAPIDAELPLRVLVTAHRERVAPDGPELDDRGIGSRPHLARRIRIAPGIRGLEGSRLRLVRLQKDGPPATHQIRAAVDEGGLATAHLVPGAAERVVHQEFDHVAGRVELVAEGQLVGVARRRAFLARYVALLLGRVVLVDPADRLVVLPYGAQLVAVDQRKHLRQVGVAGKEAVGRVGRREEEWDLLGEALAEPLQEMTVGDVLFTPLRASVVILVSCQVELEAGGVGTAAHGLADQLTLLQDLERRKAVEVRETRLSGELLHGLPADRAAAEHRVLDMLQRGKQLPPKRLLLRGQMAHARLVGHGTVRADTVLSLQQVLHRRFEDLPAFGYCRT